MENTFAILLMTIDLAQPAPPGLVIATTHHSSTIKDPRRKEKSWMLSKIGQDMAQEAHEKRAHKTERRREFGRANVSERQAMKIFEGSQEKKLQHTTPLNPVNNSNRPGHQQTAFQDRYSWIMGLDGTDEVESNQHPMHQPEDRRRSVGGTYTIVDGRVKVHIPPSPVLFAAGTFAKLSREGTWTDSELSSPFPDSRRESARSFESIATRPQKFAGHRDTLSRLYIQSCDDDEDAPSLSQSYFGLGGFNNFIHRDTLARLHHRLNHDKELPGHILLKIAAFLESKDYGNMRLTCRGWAEWLPRPEQGIAQTLPTEILSQIFSLLSSTEYDAARHTCRNWFRVGLDLKLASAQLKSSGGYRAFLEDVELRKSQRAQASGNFVQPVPDISASDPEWQMSKRNATESRLGSKWRGPGFRQGNGHASSAFNVVEDLDFRPLLDLDMVTNPAEPRHFRVSTCGKYVMVNVGTEIFVYSLCQADTSINLSAHLTGEHLVLSTSMDTSSGRLAVAAILESRKGAIWDLRVKCQAKVPSRPNQSFKRDIQTQDMNEAASATHSCNMQFSTSPLSISTADIEAHYLDETDASISVTPSCAELSAGDSVLDDTDLGVKNNPTSTPEPADKSSTWGLELVVEEPTISPSIIYTLVGTERDNPRSVAICPQRKCVAFGCRTGIELHWVDGATFTKLNRWFPLHSPSDHLYFLPRRQGIDSARKLRLISSASVNSKPDILRRDSSPTRWKLLSTSPLYGRVQSMTRLFFGSLPFPGELTRTNSLSNGEDTMGRGVLRTVDCDHYQAVPISDGSHILFTEPGTGLLCLGSDAPLGDPTKLTRKVCMVLPDDVDERCNPLECYRAGDDLRWGVRVVSAHADGSVILYNIPADCFERIRNLKSVPDIWDESAGVLGQSDLLMDVSLADEHGSTEENATGNCAQSHQIASEASNESRAFKSLLVDGQKIYHASSKVEDVQIDCANGGVTVWVFQQDGQAVKLDIYTPRNFVASHKTVNDRGRILDSPTTSNATPSPKGRARTEYVDNGFHLDAGERHVKFVVYD